MRNFLRAMKYAWPYRFRLVTSFIAAFAVAALWSATAGMIFPVLTIMSKEMTLQQWINKEIEEDIINVDEPERLKHIANLRKDTEALRQAPPTPANEQRLIDHTRDLARQEGQLQAANRKLFWSQLLKTQVIDFLPNDRFETFALIIATVLVCVMIKGFFEYWQESLVGSVVSRSVLELRNSFYRAVIYQDSKKLQQVGTPELMARVTNDAEQVGTGMKILLGKMVVEPLKMFGCLIAACYISWQLTLLFIILVVPAVASLARVSRLMKKAARKVLEQMSDLYKVVRETFDGIKVVKGFTSEPIERRKFRKVTEDYYRRSMRVIKLDALTGPITEILGLSAVSLALLAGAYLVLTGEQKIFQFKMTDERMSFETLFTLYAFLGMIADPVRRLSSVYTKIQAGAAAADRIYAVQDIEPAVQANPRGAILPKHTTSVEFKNVCFSYVPGQDPGTLNAIHLKVIAGETVAIVGANGCGKSTLLGLLPRFYDPDHGVIVIDGQNIRNVNLRSLRRQIGLVTQDTILFNDTIYANIAYGKPGASREEVEAAAKKAFAHEFIIQKPHGYDEFVGDFGGQLSGGQKQRIALARAILRDPRILILDEFTSQIDAESEAKIQLVLREFVRGRTTFLITHRAATLELADRIVVMDAGSIVAVGKHSELLEKSDVYRRIYDAQVGGKGEGLRLAEPDAA